MRAESTGKGNGGREDIGSNEILNLVVTNASTPYEAVFDEKPLPLIR